MNGLFATTLILILLSACQAQPDAQLTLPTPIVDTAEVTADTTAPVATVLPEPPTAQVSPATLPATITATKPAPAATVTPTAAATVSLPPVSNEGNSSYQVVFVETGDTLNVRSGPGTDFSVVAELPPDADGLVVSETGQSLVAGSTWVWVEGEGTAGYVNSRFLTESVSSADFCRDSRVDALLADLQTAIANRDGNALAALVHSERGLRLRQSWWNNEIVLPGDEVNSLFFDNTAHAWGTADGSGLPITGSFNEVLLPLLDRDLLPVDDTACLEVIHGPTTGLTIVPESYEGVPFVGVYRPAGTDESEFDWGTWALGVEHWEGEYFLSYLVHYAYEI